MSNETKGYNGWTNYETWCVNLWLTNEEASYLYWREEAARHRREAPRCVNVLERIWTVELAERAGLANQLMEEIVGVSPLADASLFSDLLNAALSEVDWHEVAEDFLEGIEPLAEADLEGEGDDQVDYDDDDDVYSVEQFEGVKRARIETQQSPLFELGRTAISREAIATLSTEDIEKALARHHRGDWGDVGRLDWWRNEARLTARFRLFSVYHSEDGTKFWVITEADRSSTCVLLPGDY